MPLTNPIAKSVPDFRLVNVLGLVLRAVKGLCSLLLLVNIFILKLWRSVESQSNVWETLCCLVVMKESICAFAFSLK